MTPVLLLRDRLSRTAAHPTLTALAALTTLWALFLQLRFHRAARLSGAPISGYHNGVRPACPAGRRVCLLVRDTKVCSSLTRAINIP